MNSWCAAHAEFVDRFERIGCLAQRLFGVPLAWVIDDQFEHLPGAPPSGHAERSTELPFPCVIRQPLRDAQGRALGTLVLADRQPRVFDADEWDLLEQLGRTVAAELALSWRAQHDALTGLYGREGFQRMAEAALALCRQAGLPLTLHFFDLDGFKAINDQWGHAEGDAALQTFARLLRRAFRRSDVVARLGGDEFVVLALADGSGHHTPALRRLDRLLQAHQARHPQPYALRYSVGQTGWDVPPGDAMPSQSDLLELLHQADLAMLAHKNARRAARAQPPCCVD